MRTEKHFITQSPNNGAKHYGLDTGTIVSENVRNGYCTYGFRRIQKQSIQKVNCNTKRKSEKVNASQKQ